MEKLYTVKEVAEYLGIHVQTVYVWVREERIKVVRLGPRNIRITQSALDAVVNANSESPA